MTTTYVQARKIRSSRAHRELSKQVIKEEPLCWLRLPGCTRTSTTNDHIIPVITRPDLALVRSNCRGACRSCNYRRQDRPVSQLGELRRMTSAELDRTRKARRHARPAPRRAPAAALAFFG